MLSRSRPLISRSRLRHPSRNIVTASALTTLNSYLPAALSTDYIIPIMTLTFAVELPAMNNNNNVNNNVNNVSPIRYCSNHHSFPRCSSLRSPPDSVLVSARDCEAPPYNTRDSDALDLLQEGSEQAPFARHSRSHKEDQNLRARRPRNT